MTSEKAIHHEDAKNTKSDQYERSVTSLTVRATHLHGANVLFFLRDLRVFVVKLANLG